MSVHLLLLILLLFGTAVAAFLAIGAVVVVVTFTVSFCENFVCACTCLLNFQYIFIMAHVKCRASGSLFHVRFSSNWKCVH